VKLLNFKINWDWIEILILDN